MNRIKIVLLYTILLLALTARAETTIVTVDANAANTPLNSANLLLDGAEGLTCVGNTFQSGRDDGPKGAWSPAYGIICRGLRNSVVRNNVLHDGAMKQLMLETAPNREGAIISDNPGRLFTPKSQE